MKEIQSLTENIENLDEIQADLLADILKIPQINQFVQINKISYEIVLRDMLAFLDYKYYLENPDNKVSTDNLEGQLQINAYGRIEFNYVYSQSFQILKKLQKTIKCLYMNEHILSADIKDFTKIKKCSATREALIQSVDIQKGIIPITGLFISGENGVGKTYLLSALSKVFATVNINVTIVFVPELIRDLKQNPYNANTTIKSLQNAEVLMLDDIGSEMQTSFSRDEVLLTILNARMNNKKLTYFSSNFNLEDLEYHFSQTQFGEKEPVKAKRILSRITTLSQYVELIGENMRVKG